MKKLLSIIAVALLCGCSAVNKNLIVTTSTIIGFEVAENPQTGLYQARFGYGRAEFALVPTATNGVSPNVIMELRYHGLMSRSGGIYQRLAIGEAACTQIPAALMFGKDESGNVPTNSVYKMLEEIKPKATPSR